MIGHDEPSLPFSEAVSEMVRKIKGVPASIRKPNSKSSPNEAAISKYHFTPYHHAVSAMTKF
jgi:hypothetical protein